MNQHSSQPKSRFEVGSKVRCNSMTTVGEVVTLEFFKLQGYFYMVKFGRGKFADVVWFHEDRLTEVR